MCVINPQNFIVIVIRAVVNSRRSCAWPHLSSRSPIHRCIFAVCVWVERLHKKHTDNWQCHCHGCCVADLCWGENKMLLRLAFLVFLLHVLLKTHSRFKQYCSLLVTVSERLTFHITILAFLHRGEAKNLFFLVVHRTDFTYFHMKLFLGLKNKQNLILHPFTAHFELEWTGRVNLHFLISQYKIKKCNFNGTS